MIALMRTPLLIEGSGSLARVERKKPEAIARRKWLEKRQAQRYMRANLHLFTPEGVAKQKKEFARSGIDPEKKVEHPGPRIDTDARGMVMGLPRKKHYPIGLFR